MKKKEFKFTCLLVAAAMILSFTGCEKKADTVEGLSEQQSGQEETEAAIADTSNKPTSSYPDSSDTSQEKKDSIKWNETIYGGNDGFESVDMKLSLEDYSTKEYTAYTVEAEEFNKDYIKKMCDTVFDEGSVEVYDYNHRTKRVYDDLIDFYEGCLEAYDTCKEANIESAFSFYPKRLFNENGDWEMQQAVDEFDRAVIENDINRLKSERENAPDTIENDYSYQGYIGLIDGEEYYMYFGNRNYDEYMSSPETTQYNGRVITIIKKDIESAYNGDAVPEEIVIQGMDYELDENNPFRHKRALVIDPTVTYMYVDNTMELNDDYASKGLEFLSRLGFGNYECDGCPTPLLWGSGLTNGFMYVNDYHMSAYDVGDRDGQVLRYRLNMAAVSEYEVQFSSYVDDGDPYDFNTYIDVMINDSGIVGCQIYNPLDVIKAEPVMGLIDNEGLMDIVRDSVNYRELWNNPIGRNIKIFEVNESRIVTFPIRSESNKNEYTYVPCFVLNGFSQDTRLVSTPVLIVNAIDGSIVSIDKELTGYPAGWKNGNVGHDLYLSEKWERFEKNTEKTTAPATSATEKNSDTNATSISTDTTEEE